MLNKITVFIFCILFSLGLVPESLGEEGSFIDVFQDGTMAVAFDIPGEWIMEKPITIVTN